MGAETDSWAAILSAMRRSSRSWGVAVGAALAFIVLAVAACNGGSTTPTPVIPTGTLQDDAGRQVVIPERPKRIVSIGPEVTEVIEALGASARIVGLDDFSSRSSRGKSVTELGQPFLVGDVVSPRLGIDIDALVSLRPDLVLADLRSRPRGGAGSAQSPACPLAVLQDKGIATVCVKGSPEAAGLTGALNSMLLIGQAVGESEKAKALVAGLVQRKDTLAKRSEPLPRVRVLFIRGFLVPPFASDPGFPVAEDEPLNELVQLAGGTNIFSSSAADKQAIQRLRSTGSIEEYVSRKPDVILLWHDPLPLSAKPGWEKIDAVHKGKTFRLSELRLLTVMDRAEEIARLLHPETAPITPTPSGLPDLTVRFVSLGLQSGRSCYLSRTGDEPVGIAVTIVNRGNADASAFLVVLDGSAVIEAPGLPAGQETRLWFAEGGPGPGHTVFVDVGNRIRESNEENNGASQILPPTTPPPVCTPTPRISTPTATACGPAATTTPRLLSVYFDPSTAVPGSTITLVYTICIAGAPNQPIEPRSVALSASIKGPSGTLSDPANDRAVVLPGGDTTRLFRIPPSTQPGRYDVIFTITGHGAPAETRVCSGCLTIVPSLVTPTATPSRATINVTIEPPAPKVGDTVRVTVTASAPGGIPQYTLNIEPAESPALTLPTNDFASRTRRADSFRTPVFWELKAVRAGAVTLTVSVNYETSGQGPSGTFFFFTGDISGPVTVTVTERTPSRPTATSTAVGGFTDL